MSDENSTRNEREQQLDAIIAAYYRAVEAGECLDQKDFMVQHPEFASELDEFFADLRMFQDSKLATVAIPPWNQRSLLEHHNDRIWPLGRTYDISGRTKSWKNSAWEAWESSTKPATQGSGRLWL